MHPQRCPADTALYHVSSHITYFHVSCNALYRHILIPIFPYRYVSQVGQGGFKNICVSFQSASICARMMSWLMSAAAETSFQRKINKKLKPIPGGLFRCKYNFPIPDLKLNLFDWDRSGFKIIIHCIGAHIEVSILS